MYAFACQKIYYWRTNNTKASNFLIASDQDNWHWIKLMLWVSFRSCKIVIIYHFMTCKWGFLHPMYYKQIGVVHPHKLRRQLLNLIVLSSPADHQGVYREKQLRLTVHWTRTNYNDNYIAIKPLVPNSPKRQNLQGHHIFRSQLSTY